MFFQTNIKMCVDLNSLSMNPDFYAHKKNTFKTFNFESYLGSPVSLLELLWA
ncbi:hypothetical protein EXN66_Car010358 [Channa argus]|uniref:Uncharacterized protein n=1 Tax=Channa argus TaxID=215402 RepID=A0A6G1PWP7_CHAAH|nr:hypothetical protein EXN66_Car010358 [Channa argus]